MVREWGTLSPVEQELSDEQQRAAAWTLPRQRMEAPTERFSISGALELDAPAKKIPVWLYCGAGALGVLAIVAVSAFVWPGWLIPADNSSPTRLADAYVTTIADLDTAKLTSLSCTTLSTADRTRIAQNWAGVHVDSVTLSGDVAISADVAFAKVREKFTISGVPKELVENVTMHHVGSSWCIDLTGG
jgi:hypothetical protein